MLRLMALFFGPIFAKELVEISRRKRYYFNRFLYGLVLLLTMYFVWLEYSWRFDRAGPNTHRVLVQMAETLFYAISGVQYASVFLFVPLFICGVIAGEREERTLDTLFTTDLSDREIVLGKLASRVAALVLTIICGLPFLSMIMLFGGIDPEGLWRMMASTLLAVVYVGAHAIYFSATTKTPIGALVRTYWWLAVWLLATPYIVMLPLDALRASMPVVTFFAAILLFVNPIGTFVLALTMPAYNMMAGYLGEWFYPCCFVIPLAWSSFLLVRATRAIRREPASRGRLLRFLPRLRLMSLLANHQRLWTDRRIRAEWTWWGQRVHDPLWLRSRLVRVYDREGHIGRIQLLGWVAAIFFFLLIAVCEPRTIKDEEGSMIFLSITWIAIVLLACIFAGISLVGDRRRGFLEFVLLTPLTARDIVDGTLLAVWHHLRRVFWLPWFLCLLFCLTGASLLHGALCSLITATLFTAVVVVFGVAFALTARTIPAALVPTLLFPIIANAIALMIPAFREAHGPVLWLFSGCLFLGSVCWSRKRLTPASVACFLLAIYLVNASIATCWTVGMMHHYEFPIVAMHPGALMVVMLDNNPRHWERHNLFAVLPCYWTALVVTFLVTRWWLIRNFERLVERTEASGRPRAPSADNKLADPLRESLPFVEEVDSVATRDRT